MVVKNNDFIVVNELVSMVNFLISWINMILENISNMVNMAAYLDVEVYI